jgi:N utilization substance protein B
MTVSNNQRRKMKSAARLYAVQALFQMEATAQTVDAVMREFEDHRFGATYGEAEMIEGDVDTFRLLMEKAVDEQAKIDQMTDRALVEKWPLGRIDPTLRGLFRAAGAEMLLGDTPPRVIITEFVDVAGAFFPDGKEPRFVNAVLDHMAHASMSDKF